MSLIKCLLILLRGCVKMTESDCVSACVGVTTKCLHAQVYMTTCLLRGCVMLHVFIRGWYDCVSAYVGGVATCTSVYDYMSL